MVQISRLSTGMFHSFQGKNVCVYVCVCEGKCESMCVCVCVCVKTLIKIIKHGDFSGSLVVKTLCFLC